MQRYELRSRTVFCRNDTRSSSKMSNGMEEEGRNSDVELDITINEQNVTISELQEQIRSLKVSLEASEKQRIKLQKTLVSNAVSKHNDVQTAPSMVSVMSVDAHAAGVAATPSTDNVLTSDTHAAGTYAAPTVHNSTFANAHPDRVCTVSSADHAISANTHNSPSIANYTSAVVYTATACNGNSTAPIVTAHHSHSDSNQASVYPSYINNFSNYTDQQRAYNFTLTHNEQIGESPNIGYPPYLQTAGMNYSLHPSTNNTNSLPAQIQNAQMLMTPNYQSNMRKLHDLPEFSGTPEQWPMFSVAYTETTARFAYTNFDNLLRLQKSLKGDARARVESLLIHPSSVNMIMSVLQFHFGRPDLLIRSQLAKVRGFPAISGGKINEIVNFSSMVTNLTTFLENAGALPHLTNPTLLDELVSKLPLNKREEWARHTFTINKPYPTIREFSIWLQQISMYIAMAVEVHPAKSSVNNEQWSQKNNKFTRQVMTIAEEKYKCLLCTENHRLQQCLKFKNADIKKRWDIVKSNRLCFCCLVAGHNLQKCSRRRECGLSSCKKSHNRLLHSDNNDRQYGGTDSSPSVVATVCECQTKNNPVALPAAAANVNVWQTNDNTVPSPSAVDTSNKCQNINTITNNTNHAADEQITRNNCHTINKSLFKFLPVILYGPKGCLKVIAFIDEGAKITLLEERIANQLGLKGASDLLHLKWFDDQTTTEASKCVDLEIFGVNNSTNQFHMKGVRTTKRLFIPPQTLDLAKFKLYYKELKDIPIESYTDAVPQILIGLPHINLVRALSVVNFDKNFTAHETKLGWTLFGSDENCSDNATLCHVQVECNNMDDLQKQISDYFELEGFEAEHLPAVKSDRDIRAEQILRDTTKFVGDRYETGLLWLKDDIRFPKSYNMALKRLEGVEIRMRREKEYAEWYKNKINEYIKKGYARKLTLSEDNIDDDRTWYLPHFVVYNVNKGSKPRLVFDAAAKVNGVSLNTTLMQGPDSYQPKSLQAILFKFRERKIAVCGDIREMFHRINIREADQRAQRFLWRDGNSTKEPDIYVMRAMIFGSTSSPCSAQFVKNLNASKFESEHPRAVDAIINRHYVDDYVDSFSTTKEAILVTKKVIEIHRIGGFELRGLVSNSTEVLQSIYEKRQLQERYERNMCVSDMNCNKVLGMQWNASSDTFFFKLSFLKIPKPVLEGNRRTNKAELLGITMAIFDPYGFLCNVTIVPKILLQRLWNLKIDWHDPIPNELYDKWYQWYKALDNLKDFSIPRCYNENLFDTCANIQLHIFVDASEVAYAAVGYWRIQYQERCHVVFVAGKSRCSPLKPLSIPRLELQSAVLGTRLKNIILKGHQVQPLSITFWSDSKTVIQWIRSDARNYKQFVCNRISEILHTSDVQQWRWVPGSMNPSDDATRPQVNRSFLYNSRWIHGPEFLKSPECDWPVLPDDFPVRMDDKEKRTKTLYTIQNNDIIPFRKFSNYYKFLRIMTWVRYATKRFRATLGKVSDVPKTITAAQIKQTEIMLIRIVQKAVYPREASNLNKGEPIPTSSPIFKLTPVLDNDGLLRLGGRIDSAICLPMSTRRPLILPKSHDMTNLIAQHYHDMFHHHNQEAIISAIRSKYWIPNIRSLMRSAKRRCQICKNFDAIPKTPIMGQIPLDRLTPYVRAFSYTGIDYFGPVIVSIGRRREKRWVALFTCMTIRAIHLELARDLSTDAFILCLRNFVNRRGIPVRIRSDCGTNFVGASKIKWLSIEKALGEECTRRGIEWVFNTPAHPSAGGIWERMVRSVKRVLTFTLKESGPQIETLQSLLIEAENLINSRPLTHLPVESIEAEPLTPNHFLLGCPNYVQTPTTEENTIVTKQWRILQQLKQSFWRRWIREYLPTLTRRTKWHQHVKPIQNGDVVVICDDNENRGEWKRGIVQEVFPDRDGQVRSAVVRTTKGNFRRPASKLAVLDVIGEPRVAEAP